MDLSVAAVLVLGGLVVLRWALVVFLATLMLQSARSCPACFNETISVQRPLLALVLPMAEWRWCPTCRWQGPSRKTPHPEINWTS